MDMSMYGGPMPGQQGFDPNNPLAQNNLSGAQNVAQQAGMAAQPGAGMSQQQKMMLAQALMQMGQRGQGMSQMPQMNMQGSLPGNYVSR